MTTSGVMTAANAAIGAYRRPRCSQAGKGQDRLGMKKNERVTMVLTAISTMTPKVQASVSFMACGLQQSDQSDGNCNGHHNIELERQGNGRHGGGTRHQRRDGAQTCVDQ